MPCFLKLTSGLNTRGALHPSPAPLRTCCRPLSARPRQHRNENLQPCMSSDPTGPTSASAPETTPSPAQASSSAEMNSSSNGDKVPQAYPTSSPKKKRQAESTDPISTFLTRRFGLSGGLGWLTLLAVGSLGEQIKTRIEVSKMEAAAYDVVNGVEVTLPSGVRYTDLHVGGGAPPQKGYLAVVNYTAKANGVLFEDTLARGKPIVFLYGSRPYSGGMCAGTEQAMAGMLGGGKRIITVPPALGFPSGAVLRPTEHVPDKQGIIPAGAELVYELELLRVSIPP